MNKKILRDRLLSQRAKSYIDNSNMRIGFFVSFVMGITIFILFCLSLKGLNGTYKGKFHFDTFHRVGYFIYFLAAVYLFVISSLYLKKKTKNHKLCQSAVIVYIVGSYIFCILCSIIDFYNFDYYYTFIIISILIPIIFLVSPIPTIFINMFGYLLMEIGIVEVFKIRDEGNINYILLLNIFLLGIFIIGTCIVRYKERITFAKTDYNLKEQNTKLKQLSYNDALTNLKNRYALREDYNSFINKNVVVMMSDVDDFKYYNDNFGHDVGDNLLVILSKALSSVFDYNCCYRFGGDEFLVVCTDCSEDSFLEKIQNWRNYDKNIYHNGKVIEPSCSCGYIFGLVNSENDLRRMIQLADENLYVAKRRGKNCEIGMSYREALENIANGKVNVLKKENALDYDYLTGCSSMIHFRNKSRFVVNNLNENNKVVYFIYFNIKDFKSINIKLGFAQGDKVLISLAKLLQEYFEGDLVTRSQEDHFVVVTPRKNIEEIILNVNYQFNKLWNKNLKVGIYTYEKAKIDVSLACDKARSACSSISNISNEVFKYYDDIIEQNELRKQYILDNFENALNNHSIDFKYQKIFDIKTNEPCYAECFSIWDDIDLGIIKPGEYIQILEDANLIYKLDLYMLEVIAKNYKSFAKLENGNYIPFTMNISPIDLELCDFDEEVSAILEKYGLTKDNLRFEIHESYFEQNRNSVLENCKKLNNYDYKLWVDNLGSGIFPIEFFNEIKVDVIKVSFSDDKKEDIKNNLIIRKHIFEMFREMNIDILMKDVENKEQLETLKPNGIKYVQGFYFEEPHSLKK